MTNSIKDLNPNYSHFCHHVPTGEDWYIIGIDKENERVCAGGWPASISKAVHCINFEENKPLTEEELKHREVFFGTKWDK